MRGNLLATIVLLALQCSGCGRNDKASQARIPAGGGNVSETHSDAGAGCTAEPFDNEDTRRRRAWLIDSIASSERVGQRVLTAMREVPRHAFLPDDKQERAYDDAPLLIGHGQTISQPTVVAIMTDALQPKPSDVVLEVGTGSGYQAAVLARMVQRVETIEIVEPLGVRARETLKRLGCRNVNVHIGDGYQGLPQLAPFDGIIITAAPPEIPQKLVEQLKEGGRMVLPVGPRMGVQDLLLIRKQPGGALERTNLGPVRFVPMVRADE